MTKANEPAFPLPPTYDNEGRICSEDWASTGMSIRTYIATQAMMGLLGCDFVGNVGLTGEEIAKRSVEYADALIAELEKTEK